LIFENFLNHYLISNCNSAIYVLYKQNFNNFNPPTSLRLTIGADERHFRPYWFFIKKKASFNLKTALFVEKRQNKFAYE